MKTKNFLSVIILYCFIFVSCGNGQNINDIPLKIERNKTLITVKIDSLEIPGIILDTGMPFDGIIIYNTAYRDSFDLSRAARVQIGGAGDGEPSYASMIDSAEFMLANRLFKNQRIIVFESDVYKGFPSNGIIGYSIFGHYAVEIDYDNNIMILRDSVINGLLTGWTEIPIYFKYNTIPWVDISVIVDSGELIALSAYIDYASGEAIELLEKPGMKFALPKISDDVYLGTGLSGDIYGKKGNISKLIIGGYELNNVTAVFPPARVRSKQDGADAIIGCSSFRRFNLIFDYANKKLYLKPNSHFNDVFE